MVADREERGGTTAANVAELAIAVVLRRIERQRRQPDFWEGRHLVFAMHAYWRREFETAIGFASAAGRKVADDVVLTDASVEREMTLRTLRLLFEGVCMHATGTAATAH